MLIPLCIYISFSRYEELANNPKVEYIAGGDVSVIFSIYVIVVLAHLWTSSLFIWCRCYTKLNQSGTGELICSVVNIHISLKLYFMVWDITFYWLVQWMLQHPGATSYMGCIGKDKFGEEMKKNSKSAGVNVSFIFYPLFLLFHILSPLFVDNFMFPNFPSFRSYMLFYPLVLKN